MANADVNLGEIRMFAGAVPPAGWRVCDGSALTKVAYQKLSDLLADRYGGDAVTFKLPDLRGRLTVHAKTSDASAIGQTGGVRGLSLTAQMLPNHTHAVLVSTASSNETTPSGSVYLGASTLKFYASKNVGTPEGMSAASIGPNDDPGVPHDNLMPSLSINYIICVEQPAGAEYWEAFTGEIRAFVCGPPHGWAACDGSLYRTLYPKLEPLLGTTYGLQSGSYSLPNLQGRVPMGNGFGLEFQTSLGNLAGAGTYTLGSYNLPAHSHVLRCKSPASDQTQAATADALSMLAKHPAGGSLAGSAFVSSTPTVALAEASVSMSGNPTPLAHENRQPYMALNFYICTDGAAL